MSDSDSELEQSQSSSTVPRADSKLYNSIDTYGSNSYYYAHNREFVIPDDAKVTEGPGIITGGTPVKLGESAPLSPSVVRRKIEKYSWCDDGGKVRIYIEDPRILPFITESTENVTCSFDCQSLCVEVMATDREIYAFTVPDLSEEIIAEGSAWKVSLGKRITVSLNKKNPDTKWSNLKKSSR